MDATEAAKSSEVAQPLVEEEGIRILLGDVTNQIRRATRKGLFSVIIEYDLINTPGYRKTVGDILKQRGFELVAKKGWLFVYLLDRSFVRVNWGKDIGRRDMPAGRDRGWDF